MKLALASALFLGGCASAATTAPIEKPSPRCDEMFSGPHYEGPFEPVVWPSPRVGQPATEAGIRDALSCRGTCRVELMPAGRSDAGETWTVVAMRTNDESLESAIACEWLSYVLVVANGGRITRFQYLVDTGQTCMHWREEEISAKDGVFTWRSSGYGSPASAEDMDRWRVAPPLAIDLATLTVDGCPRRVASPFDALVHHSFG